MVDGSDDRNMAARRGTRKRPAGKRMDEVPAGDLDRLAGGTINDVPTISGGV